jgi:hypothetical protein
MTPPLEGASASDVTEQIWKALRLVPEFDGNSNVLIRFLDICDQLILHYMNPAPGHDLNNSALLNGILNKITGKAATTLAANGIPRDWNGIRNTLINSFSDHRDETALYTDLSMLTQGSDTPHVFFERVQNLLTTIMTYVQLHETVQTTIEAKRSLYQKLALQTYLRGLHEPLGSRIRCMRPDSLEKALEFAQEELNILYLKNKNAQHKTFKDPQQLQTHLNYKPFNPQFNSQLIPRFNPFMNEVRPTNNFNNRMPNAFKINSPQQPPMSAPYEQGPSMTQQRMRALPRSNMTTGFRIPPRQNYQQNSYVPMSGISHPVAKILPPTDQNGHYQVNMNQMHDLDYQSEYIENYPCDYYYTEQDSQYETYDNDNLDQDIENYNENVQSDFSQKPPSTSPK